MNINNFLELVLEEICRLPSYSEGQFDEFMKKYKPSVKTVLNNVIYNNDGLAFDNKEGSNDNEKEQNGILFSFRDSDSGERKPLYYEGFIWSTSSEKYKFYALFNIFKEQLEDITIVDFLLYEPNLLIPSKLTIKSKDIEKYSKDSSEFRSLVLPAINISLFMEFKKNFSKKVDGFIGEDREVVHEWKQNKLYLVDVDNKESKVDTDYGRDSINDIIKNLKEQIDVNTLEKIKSNFKKSGVIIDDLGINDEKLINTIIMHNLSIYAKNMMIFSSGTFNNVSGLIFTANPNPTKDSNWNKIKNNSNELLLLDGALRQISVFEIRNQETVLRQRFLNDYKERSKDYEVLGKIVIAILSSLDNLYSEKIHNITMRIKAADKLIEKINSKYRKYYQGEYYSQLFFENKNNYEKINLDDYLSGNERSAKIGDIPDNVITDLCGARVIFNYKDEIDTFIKKLNHFFDCYEYDNKEKSNQEKKKFRTYTSQHFILSLNKTAIDFFASDSKCMEQDKTNKDLWKNKLSSMVFELQLRTLFEHGWADANHDLVYKAEQKEMTSGQEDKWGKVKSYIDDADTTLSALKKDVLENK